MESEVYNEDCLIGMNRYPDKYFDLAIVDPPYGINFGKYNRTNKDHIGNRVKSNRYKNSNWDNSTPDLIYFNELKRVSKNQIIWGGNYFIDLVGDPTPNLKTIEEFDQYISSSKHKWLFWYKQNPVPNFADGELAYISFNKNNQFEYMYYGNINSEYDRIHPTQKPVKLYKWLLKNYAKQGDKILDTHLGSQSSRIAAHVMGFDFVGFELDKDYFDSGNKRYAEAIKQQSLFIF